MKGEYFYSGYVTSKDGNMKHDSYGVIEIVDELRCGDVIESIQDRMTSMSDIQRGIAVVLTLNKL